MFYPFNILCIQCTFFYTSVWSLRLMLVSDIVVLILDRDLSGFYVYFASCLFFLLRLQQFFSQWRKMRKHQRKNVSNFCMHCWLIFRNVFPPLHCWLCPVHRSQWDGCQDKPPLYRGCGTLSGLTAFHWYTNFLCMQRPKSVSRHLYHAAQVALFTLQL